MSTQQKFKRIAKTAVNTPVQVHTDKAIPVSKEEAESILTTFIESEEDRFHSQANLSLNNSTNSNGSNLAQLRRIQRDFRGLPPMVQQEATPAPSTSSSTATTAGSKKHMKFDDEETKNEEEGSEENK